jgi:protein tyrosine/serine phosphatase
MTRRRMALVILLLTAGALAYSQFWVARGRVGTVAAGRLYRSAAMPEDRLLEVCRERGIRTVIDLRKASSDTAAEAAVLAGAGIRHVALPSEQVPSAETVSAFLRVIDDPAAGPILVHCTHGVGRTGVMSSIYRMEYQGWSPARATAEALLYAGFDSFWPRSEKARFLSGYVPRRSTPSR